MLGLYVLLSLLVVYLVSRRWNKPERYGDTPYTNHDHSMIVGHGWMLRSNSTPDDYHVCYQKDDYVLYHNGRVSDEWVFNKENRSGPVDKFPSPLVREDLDYIESKIRRQRRLPEMKHKEN